MSSSVLIPPHQYDPPRPDVETKLVDDDDREVPIHDGSGTEVVDWKLLNRWASLEGGSWVGLVFMGWISGKFERFS